MLSTLKRLALLGLPLAFLAQGASAQDTNEQKYQKKINQDWFTKGGWTDDYAGARARSKSQGKVILAYFTRSYAP